MWGISLKRDLMLFGCKMAFHISLHNLQASFSLIIKIFMNRVYWQSVTLHVTSCCMTSRTRQKLKFADYLWIFPVYFFFTISFMLSFQGVAKLTVTHCAYLTVGVFCFQLSSHSSWSFLNLGENLSTSRGVLWFTPGRNKCQNTFLYSLVGEA